MIARWTIDEHLGGVHGGQAAATLADGCADRIDDDDIRVGGSRVRHGLDCRTRVPIRFSPGIDRVLRMHLMSPRPNTSDLYSPVNDEPIGHDGPRRYIHVIGATVFVDDQSADDSWDRHVVAVVDGCVLWAVDVPARGRRPVVRIGARPVLVLRAGVGGRLVRRRPGRAARRVGAHASLLWPLRDADRAVGRRAGDEVPGLRARRLPAGRAGDDHARHPGRARARPGGAARPGRELPRTDVLVPRRLRRAGRGPRRRGRPRGAARRSASPSATCSTCRASRGRSRTA